MTRAVLTSNVYLITRVKMWFNFVRSNKTIFGKLNIKWLFLKYFKTFFSNVCFNILFLHRSCECFQIMIVKCKWKWYRQPLTAHKDRSVVCNSVTVLRLREFITNITPIYTIPSFFNIFIRVLSYVRPFWWRTALVRLTFHISARATFRAFFIYFYLASIPFLNFKAFANWKRSYLADQFFFVAQTLFMSLLYLTASVYLSCLIKL